MKKFSKYIFALAALALASTACVKEAEYEKGPQDVEGCYGVYFPTQEVLGSNTIDPTAPTSMTLVVARQVSENAITVPISVKGDTDVINIGEAVFEDGQSETEVTIDFSTAEVGTTYKVELSIEGDEFASKYSDKATHSWFSVLIDTFECIGTGLLRDDLITALYNAPNAEYEVEIYEYGSTPGKYYLKNAYTSKYPHNEEGDYVTEDKYFVVDASNPNKVSVPYQKLGMDWGYGEFYVTSFTDEVFNIDPSQALYGKLVDKIITFPEKSIMVSMEQKLPSFYYGNGSGLFRICLPGAVLTDYTLKLKAGQSNKGVLPIMFTPGVDVAKVKYAVFEGELYAAGVEKNAAAIADGTQQSVEVTAEQLDANNIINITLEETGVYTLVAVTYDAEGAAQKSASVSFGYVAAEDKVPVVVSAGIGSADKYVPSGVNTDTALECWIYGKDLQSVQMGVFSAIDLGKDAQACLAQVQASKPVSAEILEKINGEGYVSVVNKLNPGTEYCLIVVASNGFETKAVLSDGAYTTGDPHPVYMSFTMDDLSDELIPESSADYFGTYNYYARTFNEDGDAILDTRSYLGQVTISDSETPDSAPDEYGIVTEYMTVSGIVPYAASVGLDDTFEVEYYDGVVYAGNATLTGQPMGYYTALYTGDENGKLYNAYLLGGFVEEGYLAFVNMYADQGVNISGYFLAAFEDAAYTKYAGPFDAFLDILLVDPAKDDSGLAPKPTAPSTAQLKQISNTLKQGPTNYVETPRGNFRSIIDKAKQTPVLRGQFTNIEGERDAKAVSFSSEFSSENVKMFSKNDPFSNDANISLR